MPFMMKNVYCQIKQSSYFISNFKRNSLCINIIPYFEKNVTTIQLQINF